MAQGRGHPLPPAHAYARPWAKGSDHVFASFASGLARMREPCAGDPASRDGVANRPIRSAPSTHSQTEAIMARNTNTQAQAPLAAPAVTLTPEALKELLAEAVAEALAQKGKVDRSTDVESLTL